MEGLFKGFNYDLSEGRKLLILFVVAFIVRAIGLVLILLPRSSINGEG